MPEARPNTVRAIAHFDLDAFFVSVEQKLNPALKGCPLIVGGKGNRGVVAACSYETRAFGVHSAMPMVTALRLCPQAVVIPPQRSHYLRYSGKVTQIIAARVPLFEKASIDEFYIDFSGMGGFTDCYAIATDLRKEIMAETDLPISFALSRNKLVSKIAVDTVKPNGQICIDPGTEATFLAPMAIEKIPMIGKETASRLHKMGIFSIADLAGCSKDTLRTFFGKHGELLAERAKGIDHSPVSDERKQKSISVETTFDKDVSDIRILEKELLQLNAENAFQLRKSGYFTACIALKMRFDNFETITRQMAIAPTTSEEQLRKYIKLLLHKYYPERQRVRLIGVRYSHLLQEGFQLDLFDNDHKRTKLTQVLDGLKMKFGNDSISRAGDL